MSEQNISVISGAVQTQIVHDLSAVYERTLADYGFDPAYGDTVGMSLSTLQKWTIAKILHVTIEEFSIEYQDAIKKSKANDIPQMVRHFARQYRLDKYISAILMCYLRDHQEEIIETLQAKALKEIEHNFSNEKPKKKKLIQEKIKQCCKVKVLNQACHANYTQLINIKEHQNVLS